MSNQKRVIGNSYGQVKWFNNKKGFGFISVITGDHKDKDIFVHQTNIHPMLVEYRTLTKGEYVSLNVSDDDKVQALNVTGINGGTLMCDNIQFSKSRGRRHHSNDRGGDSSENQE